MIDIIESLTEKICSFARMAETVVKNNTIILDGGNTHHGGAFSDKDPPRLTAEWHTYGHFKKDKISATWEMTGHAKQ